MYLGSFSKTFAAGLRVGWVLAPHAVREKLVLAAESATLCPPTLNQMIVSRYLSTQDWKGQIKTYREAYRERRDAAISRARAAHAAGSTWNKPARRLLRLGDGARGHRHQGDAAARRHPRVAYASGTGFYADGLGSRQLRISYCYPTPERIREGVRRLANVIEDEMELHATFGPTPGREVSGPQSPSPDTA